MDTEQTKKVTIGIVNTRLRIALSPYMAKLTTGIGKLMDRPPSEALSLLLFRIETMARHGKLEQIGLGLEWAEIATVLNASGMGVVDAVALEGEEIDFDITILERNKSKTGYSGVYAADGSFRALVPNPEKGGAKHLPRRATALRAAIDRFEWYEKHGLPYGNVGAYVEDYQSRHPEATIDDALKMAEFQAGPHCSLKKPFTENQLLQVVNRRRELKGLPTTWDEMSASRAGTLAARAVGVDVEALRAADAAPAAPAPPEKMFCIACEDEIVEGAKWTLHGPELKIVHHRCLDARGQPFPKSMFKPRNQREPD